MVKLDSCVERSQLEYETVRNIIDEIMCGSRWNWCNHCYGICPVRLPSDINTLYQNDAQSWNRMYAALTKDLTAKVQQWSIDDLIAHARVISDSIGFIDVDLYESIIKM